MQLILVFLLASLSLSRGCFTKAGAYGRCVNIKKCEPVMKLLETRPPLKVYNELRHEHCGFEGTDPKICCEVNVADRFPEVLVTTERSLPKKSRTTTTSTEPPPPVDRHRNLRLLDHKLCGYVAPELKIYGGTSTKVFEFPWMALLAYDTGFNDGQPDFRCGATIINRNYVLTAAHCVTDLPENMKLVGVRVGEHNLAKERDCEIYDNGAAYICAEKHQDFGIEAVYPHPEYSSTNLQNDIALVRINGTMNFRPASVRPICLPIDATSRTLSSTALVTGWGSTETGSATSDVLLKVQLPILPNSECRRAYRDQPFVKLWDRQICAGGLKGKDSCNGDSGGPLQSVALYRGRPRIIQHGIVSFGRRNCAVKRSPGVYTGVAHYVDWILDNLRE